MRMTWPKCASSLLRGAGCRVLSGAAVCCRRARTATPLHAWTQHAHLLLGMKAPMECYVGANGMHCQCSW
jgi:hypothetical protein